MTKEEFLSKVPGSIKHPMYGEGTIDVIDDPAIKGACYKHGSTITSFTCFGNSWEEVHRKFSEHIKQLNRPPKK